MCVHVYVCNISGSGKTVPEYVPAPSIRNIMPGNANFGIYTKINNKKTIEIYGVDPPKH